MSSREFSLSIGRSEGYFTTALKKGSEPTADMLSSIFRIYPDLNIAWVFTGKGPMRNSDYETPKEKEEKIIAYKTIDQSIEDKIEERFNLMCKMINKLERKFQLEIQSLKNRSK